MLALIGIVSTTAQESILPPPIPEANLQPAEVRNLINLAEPDLPQSYALVSAASEASRSTVVTLRRDWLPSVGGVTRAAVFDDTSLDIVIDKITPMSGGLFTVGHIADHPELPVFFGSVGNYVSASLVTPEGKRLSISPSSGGLHTISERDDDSFTCNAASHTTQDTAGQMTPFAPDTGSSIVAPASTTEASTSAADLPSATTIVDIMVLYSTEYKTAHGGTDASVLSSIIKDIGYANEAFMNSGCPVELRGYDRKLWTAGGKAGASL